MKHALLISLVSPKIREYAFPLYEFHINRKARIKYSVDEVLFESSGNVIFPNFRIVRELAHAMNQARKVEDPQQQIRAGKLNAMGLLDEIFHFLLRYYDEKENPGVVKRAYKFLEQELGNEEFERTLISFLEEFPPKQVYLEKMSLRDYFMDKTENRLHREIALEEMLMLHIANFNPACKPFKELFNDEELSSSSSYKKSISLLDQFFAQEKPFGPDNIPFLNAIKKPIRLHPNSLETQLKYFKDNWGIKFLGKFFDKIINSIELSDEEEKYLWNLFNKSDTPPIVDTFVPEYKRRKGTRPEDFLYDEFERFTSDIDWMPNVVLLAKNTYVWLDQLSKKYQRSIRKLNEIPDEELDNIARWNFTGLWLIGIWERSNASRTIKQITGNPEAVSSAYSIYDYEIAYDLGGEEAFHSLSDRAWRRGIRLAGDMVPNHMGLYSKWVTEHPEYFIQSDYPPYPGYKFTGHNLSENNDIELRIEDGYWSRSDAAVVFQRIDKRNGNVRYIYHGNDGTSMPWNDTAQLNLLRADVREAIIQNIFHVARKFSIIRFDAAMTLAKKHFQRLWYPMPGTSGVPSRNDYGLNRDEFDALFPTEFWREVVDRINSDMPHTLLLAEAFWLMEGYFVRTLGMHRVYNSAFMHMLMKEENEKYRSLIKNTLEFNPEILKRYVNFMSNPDEQTAIAQFGKDDKYFGVATLMVTLPGLPMFAHGQIEGFSEKYGMEYQKAYYNETPDEWLVRRHEKEIFPLMRKRYLFSQVNDFEFYDFLDDRGYVNENVFAYSNRSGTERAIIFFHNKYEECKGHIKYSVKKTVSNGTHSRSVQLADAIGIQPSERIYYRFRERKSNLEYLISGKSILHHGWRMELHAFQYAVFTDFVEMYDKQGELQEIAQELAGRGIEKLDFYLQKVQLRSFYNVVKATFRKADPKNQKEFIEHYQLCFKELGKYLNSPINEEIYTKNIQSFLSMVNQYAKSKQKQHSGFLGVQHASMEKILLYFFLEQCSILMQQHSAVSDKSNVIEWLLFDLTISDNVALFKILLKHHQALIKIKAPLSVVVEHLLADFETADFLGVNQYNDTWYYNKESFEQLVVWIIVLRFLYINVESNSLPLEVKAKKELSESISAALKISSDTGYQVEKLKELSLSPDQTKQKKKITRKKVSSKGTRSKSKRQ